MTTELTRPLTAEDIRAGLQARVVGRELILRPEVESTNARGDGVGLRLLDGRLSGSRGSRYSQASGLS